MLVFTLQYPIVSQILRSEGHYQAEWSKTLWGRRPDTEAAYRWMVQQMELRGLQCNGYPPVWAWANLPTQTSVNALLGLNWRDETAWEFLTLDCLENSMLLSSYGNWCIRFFEAHLEKDFDLTEEELTKLTFDIATIDLAEDEIQATLPYLKVEWLVDCQPLIEVFETLKID